LRKCKHIAIFIYIILYNASSLFCQIEITNIIEPINKTTFGINRTSFNVYIDNEAIYTIGQRGYTPTDFSNQCLIFKYTYDRKPLFKVLHNATQTKLYNLITNPILKYYYAFQGTDIDLGCSNGGFKIFRLNKSDLSIIDSTFFCHPTQDYVNNASIFAYNKFLIRVLLMP
jgi:hypothetical protein